MEIELKLDPEQINAELVKAILETSVGAAIKRGIEKQVGALSENHYGNPITKAIEEVLATVIRDEVGKNEEKIRAVVSSWLTEDSIKMVLASFEKNLRR